MKLMKMIILGDVEKNKQLFSVRKCAAVNRDTMFDDVDTYAKGLIFSPGEGRKPNSLFTNKNIEYLAFETIFFGESHKRGDITVHYSEICKYELRSVDRRVAKNVANMFFKLKKVQIKSIKDKVTLAMRQYNLKGKKTCACDVLDDEVLAKIGWLDEGCYIFWDIENSPAYLAMRKRCLCNDKTTWISICIHYPICCRKK